MKELSIEQKAKVYDGNYKTYTELIDRLEDVKNAIKKQNYGIAMDILCKPYPEYQITTSTELKESEDEEVRKSLISNQVVLLLIKNGLLGLKSKVSRNLLGVKRMIPFSKRLLGTLRISNISAKMQKRTESIGSNPSKIDMLGSLVMSRC